MMTTAFLALSLATGTVHAAEPYVVDRMSFQVQVFDTIKGGWSNLGAPMAPGGRQELDMNGPGPYAVQVSVHGKGEPRFQARFDARITCSLCAHEGRFGGHTVDILPRPLAPMMGPRDASGAGVTHAFLILPAWSNNAGENRIEFVLRDGTELLGKEMIELQAMGFE